MSGSMLHQRYVSRELKGNRGLSLTYDQLPRILRGKISVTRASVGESVAKSASFMFAIYELITTEQCTFRSPNVQVQH